ncbi:hypothetical protein E2C01_041942 [Portunus trituberculatus]|uniref:Uncharacterized protein n=1 Tax=Portunus trituberculatus TaxID=210409 RepID=A0A5B7FV30_PORTR|nr:hypothetical protein [Portunus trituberculatus]
MDWKFGCEAKLSVSDNPINSSSSFPSARRVRVSRRPAAPSCPGCLAARYVLLHPCISFLSTVNVVKERKTSCERRARACGVWWATRASSSQHAAPTTHPPPPIVFGVLLLIEVDTHRRRDYQPHLMGQYILV